MVKTGKIVLAIILLCFDLIHSTEDSSNLNIVGDPTCSGLNNSMLQPYFSSIDAIYNGIDTEGTCLPLHKECGWPKTSKNPNLPLYVISVGLEGAGHHLWTELLGPPVFDCIWKNARHYFRDVADGVPRTSVHQLKVGFEEQLKHRVEATRRGCKRIFDSEDSFPTGAIRKSGRIMMRPDLVNIQRLDGILFNVKYLIISRNTTDTALSALRRNFFKDVAMELRTVEHTLTYLESVFKGIPCEKVFIAHYEHVLFNPSSYIEPLSIFLELQTPQKQALKNRLSRKGKIVARKEHKLDQFDECKVHGLVGSACYNKILNILEEFFEHRSFMWPSFAGNGFFSISPQS